MAGSGAGVRSCLAAMGSIVLADHTLAGLVDKVLALTVDALPGCHGASLMLACGLPDGASDERTSRIDAYQQEVGEGPCVTCLVEGEPQEVSSMMTDERWPRFANQARAEGMLSCLALPLARSGVPIGALNLYSRSLDAFSGPRRHEAQQLADGVSYAVANARDLARQTDEIARLTECFADDADLVSQANGILQERHRISAEQAGRHLREQSQSRSISLEQAARYVTASIV